MAQPFFYKIIVLIGNSVGSLNTYGYGVFLKCIVLNVRIIDLF